MAVRSRPDGQDVAERGADGHPQISESFTHDLYRFVQICGFIQICTGFYRFVQVSTDLYRFVQICTGLNMGAHAARGALRAPRKGDRRAEVAQ